MRATAIYFWTPATHLSKRSWWGLADLRRHVREVPTRPHPAIPVWTASCWRSRPTCAANSRCPTTRRRRYATPHRSPPTCGIRAPGGRRIRTNLAPTDRVRPVRAKSVRTSIFSSCVCCCSAELGRRTAPLRPDSGGRRGDVRANADQAGPGQHPPWFSEPPPRSDNVDRWQPPHPGRPPESVSTSSPRMATAHSNSPRSAGGWVSPPDRSIISSATGLTTPRAAGLLVHHPHPATPREAPRRARCPTPLSTGSSPTASNFPTEPRAPSARGDRPTRGTPRGRSSRSTALRRGPQHRRASTESRSRCTIRALGAADHQSATNRRPCPSISTRSAGPPNTGSNPLPTNAQTYGPCGPPRADPRRSTPRHRTSGGQQVNSACRPPNPDHPGAS